MAFVSCSNNIHPCPCSSLPPCSHPQFINNTCRFCKAVNNNNGLSVRTIRFEYLVRGLSLSLDEINRIRNSHLRHLLFRKKLRLVLDLDHTLLHSKTLNELWSEDREFLKDPVYQISCLKDLYSKDLRLTKLRPYVRTFLEEVSAMFDLAVYTMGCRQYAHAMARILDPEKKYLSDTSLISREDCTVEGKKGLDVLLTHERAVVVVDDTEKVWESHPRNLVKIAPYNFFVNKLSSSTSTKSWSELKSDESKKHGELARVLRMLRKIHSSFYHAKDGREYYYLYYATRDVRDSVDMVKREFSMSCEVDEVHGNLGEAREAVCVDIQVC